MQGFQLTFSTIQSRKRHGMSIADVIASVAKNNGIGGVTVINAAKGFGHDGVWHSAAFFELSDQPVEVVMIVTEEECNKLMDALKNENLGVFYTKIPVEYGVI